MKMIAPQQTREVLERAGDESDFGPLSRIENPLLQIFSLLPDIHRLIPDTERRGAAGDGRSKSVKAEAYRVLARGSVRAAVAATRTPILSASSLVIKDLLQELANRQKRVLEALPGGYVLKKLCLSSSLTCGLSQPTLLENGLTLLRPYGIPIVPASSVKGTVSSWLAEILVGKLNLESTEEDRALRDAEVLPLFGFSTDRERDGEPRAQRGAVTFFDALPLAASFEPDVTTVHYPSWYAGDGVPSGTENPNPVPFLTVAPGTRFQFGIAIPPNVTLSTAITGYAHKLKEFGITDLESPKGFLTQLVVSTGKFKGFGAQTTVGYGRMAE